MQDMGLEQADTTGEDRVETILHRLPNDKIGARVKIAGLKLVRKQMVIYWWNYWQL